MPDNTGTGTTVLSCLHTLSLSVPPRLTDKELWCPRCASYRSFIPPTNYRIKCHDCMRYRRNPYGNAIITAETAAAKHAAKFPGHTVDVLDNNTVVSTRQFDAPNFDDVPPF